MRGTIKVGNSGEYYVPASDANVRIVRGVATGAIGGTYGLSGTAGQADAGAHAGGTYSLRGGFWLGGSAPTVDVALDVTKPLAFQFRAPSPNPARSQSRISFDLPSPADVRLRVYDASGRAVRTMALGRLTAGHHDQVWSTADDEGRRLSGGMYFMQLEAGENRAVRKLLVTR